MIRTIIICDKCGKEVDTEDGVHIHAEKVTSSKGGILLPKFDWEFCSLKCLLEFSKLYLKDDG